MKQTIYKNNIEDEKAIWTDAVFVFDSSALLNFYDYSEEARTVLNKKIFRSLKDRLWITNQTEYEYLRNREKVLLKPEKLYDELMSTHFDAKQVQTIKNQLLQLQNRTKKQDKHPHIKESFFKKFEAQLEAFESQVSAFTKELGQEIELKKKEIQTIKGNDTIQKIIEKHFDVTAGYDYDQLIEIVKEGEFRYRNSIPPGYEDLKDKIGFQVYGDLIIWKQIIDLAIIKQKPIVLIIDDLKIDWCYQNSRDKNLIDAPREELLKEIQDKAGVKFLAYSSTQFLQKSKDILGISITDEIIHEVNKANQFNILSQVESAVYEWAVKQWKEIGDVYRTDDINPADIVVAIDGVRFAIEVKYYPATRKQNIKSLIDRLHPKFEARGYYDIYEQIDIVIVCENIEYAKELNDQKYELPTQLLVRVGYLNSQGEFESLK